MRVSGTTALSRKFTFSPKQGFCGNVFTVFKKRYAFNGMNSEENPLPSLNEELFGRTAVFGTEAEVADSLARFANHDRNHHNCAWIWLRRIEKDGRSVTWMTAIDYEVRDVEITYTYRLDANAESFELRARPWGRIYPKVDKPMFKTIEQACAFALMRLLNAGLDRRLQRCAATDCDNFHFRRGKWCSSNCGVRMRQRKKRKLDKERQML